jgi:hypothetical protein
MKSPAAILLICAVLLPGQDKKSRDTEDAFFTSLGWLLRHQEKDGSWRADRFQARCGRFKVYPGRCPAGFGITLESLSDGASPLDAAQERQARNLIRTLLTAKDPGPSASKLADLGPGVAPLLKKEGGARAQVVVEEFRRRKAAGISPYLLTALSLHAFWSAGYSRLHLDKHQGIVVREGIIRGFGFLKGALEAAEDLDDALTLCTVALAWVEGYWITGSDRDREPAQKALDLLLSKQGKDGAWGDPMASFFGAATLFLAVDAELKLKDPSALRKCLAWARARVLEADRPGKVVPELAILTLRRKKDPDVSGMQVLRLLALKQDSDPEGAAELLSGLGSESEAERGKAADELAVLGTDAARCIARRWQDAEGPLRGHLEAVAERITKVDVRRHLAEWVGSVRSAEESLPESLEWLAGSIAAMRADTPLGDVWRSWNGVLHTKLIRARRTRKNCETFAGFQPHPLGRIGSVAILASIKLVYYRHPFAYFD